MKEEHAMKKISLLWIVCLFSIVLASSVYAIDFKSVDTPTANDTKAIQGLNENGSSSLGGSGAKK